jgi:DNA-binding protein YbaB
LIQFLVEEQSTDGLLKITILIETVKSITIDDALLEDKEQLEDYMVLVDEQSNRKSNKSK